MFGRATMTLGIGPTQDISSLYLISAGFNYERTQTLYDFVKRPATFYSAPQCSHASNSVRPSVCPSVRLSVTRRYCVKTTARSTVQLALLDSKMCLVL